MQEQSSFGQFDEKSLYAMASKSVIVRSRIKTLDINPDRVQTNIVLFITYESPGFPKNISSLFVQYDDVCSKNNMMHSARITPVHSVNPLCIPDSVKEMLSALERAWPDAIQAQQSMAVQQSDEVIAPFSDSSFHLMLHYARLEGALPLVLQKHEIPREMAAVLQTRFSAFIRDQQRKWDVLKELV